MKTIYVCIKSVKWVRLILITLCVVLIALYCLLPKLLPFVLEYFYSEADGTGHEPSPNLNNFGVIGDSYGILNTLFSGLAFFGVLYTLYRQHINERKVQLENSFYRMLDCQQKIIDEMTVNPVTIDKKAAEIKPVHGRKVFVEYKIQLKYLMKAISEISAAENMNLSEPDVADIAYSVFYYGSSPTWKPFMMEYLKDYENSEKLTDAIIKKINNSRARKFALERTNQNYMSVYCRNMYNAIKMIDSSDLLTREEKSGYIKLLRAQLCNAELYVLFFNLISRFGKKWIDNDFVEKYQLIQNLPSKYCDGYNPKDYFPNIKYEGEEKCISSFHEIVVPRA